MASGLSRLASGLSSTYTEIGSPRKIRTADTWLPPTIEAVWIRAVVLATTTNRFSPAETASGDTTTDTTPGTNRSANSGGGPNCGSSNVRLDAGISSHVGSFGRFRSSNRRPTSIHATSSDTA